jgi:hypothetical protein
MWHAYSVQFLGDAYPGRRTLSVCLPWAGMFCAFSASAASRPGMLRVCCRLRGHVTLRAGSPQHGRETDDVGRAAGGTGKRLEARSTVGRRMMWGVRLAGRNRKRLEAASTLPGDGCCGACGWRDGKAAGSRFYSAGRRMMWGVRLAGRESGWKPLLLCRGTGCLGPIVP